MTMPLRWVVVSSLETKNVIIYELDVGVPKLTHLCRMVVRQAMAFRPYAIEELGVPKSIKAFLNYEH
jgi:hypothetical protein